LLCVRSREGNVVLEPVGTGNKDRSLSFHAGLWVNTTLYYLIKEAQNPSSQPMLARLTELMFVEVLRHYMQELGPDQKGWLAGLKDPNINRALTLLHAQPARLWTVEDLARDTGVSRSALAERFTELIGESPMRYLTRCACILQSSYSARVMKALQKWQGTSATSPNTRSIALSNAMSESLPQPGGRGPRFSSQCIRIAGHAPTSLP